MIPATRIRAYGYDHARPPLILPAYATGAHVASLTTEPSIEWPGTIDATVVIVFDGGHRETHVLGRVTRIEVESQ